MHLTRLWELYDASTVALDVKLDQSGRHVYLLTETHVSVRESRTGELLRTLELPHKAGTLDIGRNLVAVGGLGLATTFDLKGTRLCAVQMPREQIKVHISSEDRLSCVSIFEVQVLAAENKQRQRKKFSSEITCVRWMPSGKELLLGFATGKICVVEGYSLETIRIHQGLALRQSPTSILEILPVSEEDAAGPRLVIRWPSSRLTLLDPKTSRHRDLRCPSSIVAMGIAHHLVLVVCDQGTVRICNTHFWDAPLSMSFPCSVNRVFTMSVANDCVLIGSLEGTVAAYRVVYDSPSACQGPKQARATLGTLVRLDHAAKSIKCREIVEGIALYHERIGILTKDSVLIYNHEGRFDCQFEIDPTSSIHACSREKNQILLTTQGVFLIQGGWVWNLVTDNWVQFSSSVMASDTASRKTVVVGCRDGSIVVIHEDQLKDGYIAHKSEAPISLLAAMNGMVAFTTTSSPLVHVVELEKGQVTHVRPLRETCAFVKDLFWNTEIEGMLVMTVGNQSLVWYEGLVTPLVDAPIKTLWGSDCRLCGDDDSVVEVDYQLLMERCIEHGRLESAYVLCNSPEHYDLVAKAFTFRRLQLSSARKCWVNARNWRRIAWLDTLEDMQVSLDEDLLRAFNEVFERRYDAAVRWFKRSASPEVGIKILLAIGQRGLAFALARLSSCTPEGLTAALNKVSLGSPAVESLEAAKLFLKLGEYEKALPILESLGQWDMICDSIVKPSNDRSILLRAGQALVKAGDVDRGIQKLDKKDALSLCVQQQQWKTADYLAIGSEGHYARLCLECGQIGRASRYFARLGDLESVHWIRSTFLDQCLEQSRFYEASQLDEDNRAAYLAYARLLDGCYGAGLWLLCFHDEMAQKAPEKVQQIPGILSAIIHYQVARLARHVGDLGVVNLAVTALSRLRHPSDWSAWIDVQLLSTRSIELSCVACEARIGTNLRCPSCEGPGLLPIQWCGWTFQRLDTHCAYCTQCGKRYNHGTVDWCWYCGDGGEIRGG